MGNEKRSYLMKALHGLQERTRLPPASSAADEADHDTTTTPASSSEEEGDPMLATGTEAPPVPADQKRIVLREDEDDDDNQHQGTGDLDLDEEALDDEATELEDAFAFARKDLRRKPCNHNQRYAIDSLAVLANVPLKAQVLQLKETMLDRMPGFPIDQLEHDVERFFKFYSNLVAPRDEGGGGRKTRVLPAEMGKRVMLYEALVRALNGGVVDVEEARLLMTLGSKSFVVAVYALMNEFEYRMYKDIFQLSPGVGVDASDVFDQYLTTAFQKGCALLHLQPSEPPCALMVLVAIVDSLAPTELEALVSILRRDGFVCLSSDLPLEDLHDTVETKRAQPIVIYGDRSMDVPYDDCSRIWLCCGPTADNDAAHAAALHYWDKSTSFAEFSHAFAFDADAAHGHGHGHANAPSAVFAGHLARRQRAVQCGFHFMTFPRALSFMAEAIAPERVQSMGLEDGVRRIVLRYVTK